MIHHSLAYYPALPTIHFQPVLLHRLCLSDSIAHSAISCRILSSSAHGMIYTCLHSPARHLIAMPSAVMRKSWCLRGQEMRWSVIPASMTFKPLEGVNFLDLRNRGRLRLLLRLDALKR